MFHVIVLREMITHARKLLIWKFFDAVSRFCLPELDEIFLIDCEDKPLVIHDVIVNELGKTYMDVIRKQP